MTKDNNHQQPQERAIDSGNSCEVEKGELGSKETGEITSSGVEDHLPNSSLSPADTFNLSKKQFETEEWKQKIYLEEDVKEFIRLLKERIRQDGRIAGNKTWLPLLMEIDKLAGDKLI